MVGRRRYISRALRLTTFAPILTSLDFSQARNPLQAIEEKGRPTDELQFQEAIVACFVRSEL